MRKSVFRFKLFECSHARASMKIGVDAVLIGAWADTDCARRILDVGTGCGVIALMCAQRNAVANVTAIDIDADSVDEARDNFMASPWSSRLDARLEDFNGISEQKFDLIVSNPPYFDSGVYSPDSPRLVARHQNDLSPASLLRKGSCMLSSDGKIAIIVPSSRFEELCGVAASVGLRLTRAQFVRGHEAAPVKRVLMEFSRSGIAVSAASIPVLTLETHPGQPTEAHRRLCKDFYLKF
ncbi:MAG: methyltransferase [Muribaculaceae bacterium]|nr:methyltransferase [Muribaculaceae bacterium]